MKGYYDDGQSAFYHGDVCEVLSQLPAESVQTVVTSPPYWGLRDYGQEGQLGLEPTPEAYVERMVAVFRDVRRVLRDDGTVWLNLGDSYTSGGRDTRDPGQSKIHPAFNDWEKGKRPETPSGLKPKDLVGIPWRVAFALQADGWYLRSDIIWAKPNPMPESVTDRPTKAHEYLFLLTKRERYYYNADAVREPQVSGHPSGNGFKRDHRLTYRDANGARGNDQQWLPSDVGRNARSVWTIATEPYPDAHFAVFPTEIPRRCILAGSREGDTVLDPFLGSGTTALVAKSLGRRAIGIDLSAAYLDMAVKRCRQLAFPLEPTV